jgi:hypothetical protein
MPETAALNDTVAAVPADAGTNRPLHVSAAALIPRCSIDLLKAQKHVENGSVNLAVTLLSKYRRCGDAQNACRAMDIRCGIPEMLERVFGDD